MEFACLFRLFCGMQSACPRGFGDLEADFSAPPPAGGDRPGGGALRGPFRHSFLIFESAPGLSRPRISPIDRLRDTGGILTGFRSKSRINHTRLLALCLFAALLAGRGAWTGVGGALFDLAGLAGVIIGAFGRLWSSIFIAGYKTDSLVRCGPYSVTRNPLYLFSLVGAVGVGLASRSLLVPALLAVLFGVYYPVIIRREEERLRATHGPEYLSYREAVPRFFPKLSLYREPETYVVNTKNFKKALLDATFFLWIYGAVQLMGKLHDAGVLPTFLKIP